jgi:hypothetical protein
MHSAATAAEAPVTATSATSAASERQGICRNCRGA